MGMYLGSTSGAVVAFPFLLQVGGEEPYHSKPTFESSIYLTSRVVFLQVCYYLHTQDQEMLKNAFPNKINNTAKGRMQGNSPCLESSTERSQQTGEVSELKGGTVTCISIKSPEFGHREVIKGTQFLLVPYSWRSEEHLADVAEVQECFSGSES